MAAVIYAPAVALAPVMNVDKNVVILVSSTLSLSFFQVLGLSTTLYTCIGGMKAVVWTDSLQVLLNRFSLNSILGHHDVWRNCGPTLSRNQSPPSRWAVSNMANSCGRWKNKGTVEIRPFPSSGRPRVKIVKIS